VNNTEMIHFTYFQTFLKITKKGQKFQSSEKNPKKVRTLRQRSHWRYHCSATCIT